MDAKAALRAELLRRREQTSEELIKIASDRIHRRLKKIDVFASARTIACYYPIRNEPRTQEIMQEAASLGRQICLPRVDGNSLDFRLVDDISSLEPGMWDILEPRDDCPRPEGIDVVLVPMVGAAPDGTRLGYGRGYYDRFLSGTDAVSIGLTYAKQMVKSIPSDSNDVRMNWIVTEDDTVRVP